MTLLLFGSGAWRWSTGDHWLGAVLIAVGAAFPVARVLVDSSRGRTDVMGIPPEAIQPGILAVLVLALAFCELAGIGFRQDVARGVVLLFAAALTGYGVLLIARAFRSRD